MISIDLLEVLLRSVPQYFLFAALGFFIFSYINKKPLYSMIAEIILIVIGLLSFYIWIGGYVPSPETEGMNAIHLKSVLKMLMFFSTIGLLSVVSLVIRIILKKGFKPLIIAIFVLSMILFFESTRLSRVKFELNKPVTTTIDSLK